MTKFRSILPLTAAFWLLHGTLAASVAVESPLEIRIKNYSVQGVHIMDALAQLRVRASPRVLLFSVEAAPFRGVPERNLTLSIENGTVGQALQEIMKQDPRYDFEIIDNFLIHVFPRESRHDPRNLLNIHVEHFKVSEVGYDELVRYLPYHIPPLQAEMIRRNRAGGVAGSLLSGVGVPTVSLDLKNVTVRDILNRAAQESERFKQDAFGPAGWVYTFEIDDSVPAGGHPRWDLF